MRQRALMMFYALDHFCFCMLVLGNCRHYEMASSAAFDLERKGKWQGRLLRPVIDALLQVFTGPKHCERSWEWQRHIYEGTP